MKLKSILFLVQNSDVFNLISSTDDDTVSRGVQIINSPYSLLSQSGSVISRKRPLHLNGWRIKSKLYFDYRVISTSTSMEDREAASLVHWNLDQRPQLSNCAVFLEEDTLLTQCSLHPGVERPENCNGLRAILQIAYFTVVCLVARPLNRSEAEDDLVMIETLLLSKVLCFHAK